MPIVRALPVLYACAGCAQVGQGARELAARLERAGLVEAVWLGAPPRAPKARFPIIALDSCAEACALKWLAQCGVRADRHYLLSEPGAAPRIAAELA